MDQAVERQDIIDAFEALLRAHKDMSLPDLYEKAKEVEGQFHEATKQLEHILEEKYLAEGGEEGHFVYERDQLDFRFAELENIYADTKRKRKAELNALEQENLKAKRQIVQDLHELIHKEERINKAFNEFNRLREKWKNTGPVPGRYYKQLQSDYNHQIDLFYYTIRIYQDLKELDYHKNLDTKKDLIVRMQELAIEPSINKMENMARALQEEWVETGPVPHHEWEKIRDEFKEASSQVYHKINLHYKALKEKQKENLSKKKALLQKAEAIATQHQSSLKKWNDKTGQLIALQKEWRETGYAPKNINEKIWKQFRETCNTFFSNKKKFIESLQQDYEKNKALKEVLLAKAEELKDSDNWTHTAEELKKIQRQWTDTGPAKRSIEQKLWKKFRAACDHFFEARKTYYSTLDERKEKNAALKQDLLNQLPKMVSSDNENKDLETIQSWIKEWDNFNPVPGKSKSELENRFRQELSNLCKRWNIPIEKLSSLQFNARIDRLKKSPVADKLFKEEKRNIREKIARLEETIKQYENNMQFFKPGNKANPLLDEIISKIDQSREQVSKLKAQLKQLNKSVG